MPHAHSHGARSALTRADPQPRQPRTLIRVPCDGPHALVAICRSVMPCSFARHAGPAPTPSWPPWRLRRLDHALRVTATAPAMSRTTTKLDVLRHRVRGPAFRDRLQRWKLHPETRCREDNHRAREPVTLIATGTAIYQDILVPMRGASVLRPSTQALDGVPCPPASRLGPPLAARLRLTLHSGPRPGDWPVRLLRESFGWG